MANRVTALSTHVLLASGSSYVTALRLAAWADAASVPLRITSYRVGAYTNDKTVGNQITTLKVGVLANDKTNGVFATTLRAYGWASLDQGLYFGGVFGGSEVFEPDLFADPDFEIPEAPVIEVNPYRAAVPNDDLQRIIREQHNVTQAGDSTFHWGVLTEISNEALYTLGSAGRFYHDTLGIIKARYCKFVDFVRTSSRAVPVGLRGPTIQPWVVTNQFNLSSANQAVGIAMPYNDQVFIGEWYGWVITEGYVPVELQVEVTASQFEFGTEYGWQATGYVDSGLDVVSLGYRTKIGGNLRLPPGDFYTDTDRSSLGRVNGLVTARIAPLVSDLGQLTTDLTTLQGTVAGHTQQLATHTSDIAAVNARLTREVANLSNALSSIRSLMPDSNFKEYVDTSVENLKGYVDVNISLVGGNANAALLRANQAYALAESISYDAIQVQISALNDSMGGITDRIVGFKTTIDTNTLTAGQVLVSYLYNTDVDGVDYYDFRPVDFTLASLEDVDLVTIPPADGDSLTWDAATQKWVPAAVSGGGGGGGGHVGDEAPYLQPVLASFTQRLGTGASASNYAKGIVLSCPITSSNVNDLTYCVKTIITPGAAGWKATTRLKRTTPLTNWMATGMILRDSVGGRSRIYWLGSDSTQGFNWNQYTNDTTWGGVAAIMGWFFDMDFWMQIEDNLTNHIIRVSKDGYNFQEIFRHSRTTWMTPDQVGFFLNPNGGGSSANIQTRPMPFACLSWEMVALP